MILGGTFLAARCGGNPNGPRPSDGGPTLSCPASQTLQSSSGTPIPASYPSLTVSGGVLPLTIACTPPSGATFPIGSSTVTCTATDARQQAGSCTFTVTVQGPPPPRLTATRFAAFGDSITEGKLLTVAFAPFFVPSPPFSFPFKLEALLASRYTAQSVSVLDEGVGGERVEAGVSRLPGVLSADNADALLLIEGANNLVDGSSAIPAIVSDLRAMIGYARGRGLPVFVGTLLPQRPGGSRVSNPALVPPLNDQIRPMVGAEQATLVDLYQGFGGNPDPLIGPDGLHPTEAGYEKIAQLFFDAIRSKLELASSPPGLTSSGR